jgi:hypothetical protein
VEIGSTSSGFAIAADEAGKIPTLYCLLVKGFKASAVWFKFEVLGVCAFALSELPKGAAIATTVTKTGDKRIFFGFLFTSTHHH